MKTVVVFVAVSVLACASPSAQDRPRSDRKCNAVVTSPGEQLRLKAVHCQPSAVLIPLTTLLKNRVAVEIGGPDPDEAVHFDITADGALDQVIWPRGGTAFLALDRNENGLIDDGTELFGITNGYSNGFLELIALSKPGLYGYLDASHPVWPKLLLWTDQNRDGVSQSWELEPVSKRLRKIGLGYEYVATERDEGGNAVQCLKGWAEYDMPGQPVGDNDFMYPIFEVVLQRRP